LRWVVGRYIIGRKLVVCRILYVILKRTAALRLGFSLLLDILDDLLRDRSDCSERVR